MKHLRGRTLWLKLVFEQRQWIEKCGGDLAGYITNYHGKYGRTVENATEIYRADVAELQKLEQLLAKDR